MENFREKLKFENIIIAIACFVLAAFCFLAVAAEMEIVTFFQPAGDSHWQSMWRGFIMGAAFALLAMMLFALIRNILALRDEKKLKKLYIKENDERAIKVWTSARAAALQVYLILGIVAVVVAGYFSMTVSLTILGCIWFPSVFGLLFKVYYNKKF